MASDLSNNILSDDANADSMELDNRDLRRLQKFWTGKTTESLKHKIRNILYSTVYCGLCMNINDNMSTTQEYCEIMVNGNTHNKTLRDIIDAVFTNVQIDNILTNTLICNSCTNKLIQTYIFIQQTVDTAKLITQYVQDVLFKATDIYEHIEKIDVDISNTVVIFEKGSDKEQGVTIIEKDSLINVATEETNNYIDNVSVDNVYIDDTVDYAIYKKNDNELAVKKKYHPSVYQCLSCNIRLPTMELRRQHEMEHKNLKCNVCLKIFDAEKYLVEHYKAHYEAKCKVCGVIIVGKLVDHMKIKHKDCVHICDQCDLVFYNLNDLQIHESFYHSNPDINVCDTCLKSFPKENLTMHKTKCQYACHTCNENPCFHSKYLESVRVQKANHSNLIKCPDCDYVCEHKQMLLMHANQIHLDHYRFICDNCGEHFHCKLELTAHIHKSHSILVCEYCDIQFSDSSEYTDHTNCCKMSTRDFWCDMCPASFNDKEDLETHERKRHDPDEVFPCSVCNINFTKNWARHEHMVKVHSHLRNLDSNSVKRVPRLQNPGEKMNLKQLMLTFGSNIKFKCELCDTIYDTLKQYRAHRNYHLGHTVICHICGKKVKQDILEKHIDSHRGSLGICEKCGKMFKTISKMKQHQKVHSDCVSCDICDKSNSPLCTHNDKYMKKRRKDGKPLYNYQCDQCEYSTSNKAVLECHVNKVHFKIAPYMCQVCGQYFTGKCLWRRHVNNHTLEKDFKCQICMKRTASLASLKKHLRTHTGEKPFLCKMCDRRFISNYRLKNHLACHFDRNVQCPLCTKKFHNFFYMKKHLVHIHWKQNKPFDPRELKGLENHLHLFKNSKCFLKLGAQNDTSDVQTVENDI